MTPKFKTGDLVVRTVAGVVPKGAEGTVTRTQHGLVELAEFPGYLFNIDRFKLKETK